MRLYIASTSEYSGKTLIALALGRLWSAAGLRVGYVKPLGKIPVVEPDGRVIDDDAAFLARALDLPGPAESVCPVVVTQDVVMSAYHDGPALLADRVAPAIEAAAARCEVLLVGGAANLRDGTFLGLSPLEIVETARCRVLLMDKFAGERSMDQILWARRILGDRLLGVVFNRVAPAQEEFVRETVAPFVAGRGIPVFGAVPEDALLGSVTAGTLAANLAATVACGEEALGVLIERLSVGAMDVEHAFRAFRRVGGKAVVTGGYRADIQLAALETDTRCLILTGGIPPAAPVLDRAKELGVPVLVTPEDTMAVVERFERLAGRLRIREAEKAERGVALVAANVDAAGILRALRRPAS